jgi:hypothetical protein
MATLAALQALLLYLAPLAALMALRSRRDRPLWEIALDVPLAVALDLLLIHVLARVLRLETAVIVSRPLWLGAAAVAWLVRARRGARPEWPAALRGADLGLALLAAAAAVAVSLVLSRAPYAIWDRRLHIPLVSALRAQKIPFSSPFDAGVQFYYHFAGDVLAAELQVLSSGVIGASHALSLAHDAMFGLLGATVALLVRGLGVRSAWVPPVAALALVLEGPVTFLRAEKKLFNGYSFTNWLTLSYRPHVSLAALLYVGVIGAAFVRLRDRDGRAPAVPVARTAPVLLACAATLAITDEASLGLLGLALGLTWLVAPEVLHEKRLVGVGLLAGLAAALVLPNLAFGGALGPGAPHRALLVVPWRSPGYHNPPLSLGTAGGAIHLFWDFGPAIFTWLGGLLAMRSTQSRALRVSFAFFTALFVPSVLGLTRLEIGGEAYEAHRFATAVALLAPALALGWTWLVMRRDAGGGSRVPVSAAVLVASMAMGPVSTTQWLLQQAPIEAHKYEQFWSHEDPYAIDCRADYGARLGESPRLEYVAKGIFHGYTGCHPAWVPGRRVAKQWDIKTESLVERPALAEVEKITPAADPLRMECPAGATDFADPACAWAMARKLCAPLGRSVLRCDVPAGDRKAMLKEVPATPAAWARATAAAKPATTPVPAPTAAPNGPPDDAPGATD